MDIIVYALCKKYVKDSLEGMGALKGKSAYEVAQLEGYKGSQSEWVKSLKGIQGEPGFTPYIGDNGNWFINKVDLGVPARATQTYNDLQDKPQINNVELKNNLSLEDLGINIPTTTNELKNDSGFITKEDIPTKVSIFENDSEYITSADIPQNVSAFTNDAGYLISDDIKDLAQKTEIPTKVSQLTNDAKYLTSHQKLKTINGESLVGSGNIELEAESPIEDVQVNGKSVVEDKIAKIVLSDIDATMRRDFTTTKTVGYLEEGTEIKATDTVADILYRILCQKKRPDAISVYFGGSDDIPDSIDNLLWFEEFSNLDPMTLLQSGMVHIIKTGNPLYENDKERFYGAQYPVIACEKGVQLVELKQWSSHGAEGIPIPFISVEKEDYYLYYITNRTYNEDIGGATFVFTFKEGGN